MSNPSVKSSNISGLICSGESWRKSAFQATASSANWAKLLIIDLSGDAFSPTEDFEKLRAMLLDLVKMVDCPDTPHAAHPMRPEWFVRDMSKLLRSLN